MAHFYAFLSITNKTDHIVRVTYAFRNGYERMAEWDSRIYDCFNHIATMTDRCIDKRGFKIYERDNDDEIYTIVAWREP